MLTIDEKKLILSALAFASSSDVIANFSPVEEHTMADLAVRLREEYNIDELDSVYIPYKTKSDMVKWSSKSSTVSKFTDFIEFE
jgi:hypothetical protein